jgi:PAS domain S-box-containing protein
MPGLSAEGDDRRLLEQVPAAVVAVDLAHVITRWSPGAEALYGWTEEQALGRSVRELIFASDTPNDGIAAQTHSGRVWEGEVLVRHRDGHRLLVFVRNAPILDDHGAVVGVVGVSMDVTNVRRLEADREAAVSALGSRFDQTAERIASLQHLTAALVPAREQDDVVKAVLNGSLTVLPAVAAGILLLDEAAMSLRLAGSVGFPEQVASTYAVLPLAFDSPATQAIRTQSARLYGDAQAFTDAYPLLDSNQGFQARAAVPVSAGGRPLGALTLAFAEAHEFDDAEVQLLHALAAQCGQALERCRLLASERAASSRAAFLGRASDRLGHSLNLQETLEALLELLVPEFADWVVVHLREGQQVVVRATAHRFPTADRALRDLALGRTLDLASEGGAAEALRTQRSVLYAELPDHLRRRLEVPGQDAASRLTADTALAAPMVSGEEVLGVLSLARVDGQAYVEADVTVVEQLAARAALALTRSRAYQRARESALALQRNLLPQAPPDIPGLEIAWRYLPGAEGELVGGDWYDVLPLQHGRVGLVIGDVMGRGVEAAAVMGQLRAMARAYAQAGLRPGAVLQHLDAALPGLQQDAIATLLFVELDPASGAVVAASAGHLPAVIVGPGREGTSLLELDPGAPLGVGHGEFVETRRVLSRGSTLLLYTDGLVESSAQPVGVGISHLLQCLDAQKDIGDRRPEQLCDRVLGALLHGGGASDDTALLAVALDQHVDEVATPYLNAVLTGAQDLGELRRTVRRRCGLWQVTDDLADNALLVVTELATNALLHVGAPVTVTVRLQPGGLRVEVHDASSDRLPLPALSSLHTPSGDDLDAIVAELSGSGTTGRGMLLVSGLCDSWGVAAEPEGKTVWASLTTESGQHGLCRPVRRNVGAAPRTPCPARARQRGARRRCRARAAHPGR